MKAQYGDISLTLNEHMVVLEIDRPPHNHVTADLMRSLADALSDVDAEPNVRVSVLMSAGKNFCAGAHLEAPSKSGEPKAEGAGALYAEVVRLFSARKPIVAAIQGAAVGAGLGLALIADFRIAATEARFAANFVKLGFHPGFGITHTLPRVVGAQKAALMFLTGRRIKAESALDWGLVDEIVALEKLRETAMALGREIAENAPLAVQSTRATLRDRLARMVRTATDRELGEQTTLRKTSDFAEGVRAVRERRLGNFTGS